MNRFDLLMKVVDNLYGRRKLGEILLDDYEITQGDLDEALQAQKEDPGLRRLGYILLSKGFITATALMSALSRQLEVCVPYRKLT